MFLRSVTRAIIELGTGYSVQLIIILGLKVLAIFLL